MQTSPSQSTNATTLMYHLGGLPFDEILADILMEIGIVGLKDHRSPTTVGYIDVAPVPAQSTNGTSKAWGISIEK